MARILGYIASSLDGFIADADNSLQWLFDSKVELGEHHYDRFLGRMRTVVMGRATYDWLIDEGVPSPYPQKRTIVVTSRPLEAPAEIEIWNDGVESLIARLRGLDDGDVWMLGGGRLQMAFMERGALDEIEIYVMPKIIGGGAPLFPPTGFRASPRLISALALGGGGVRLHYAFDPS
jgi:dihydrofolate reductase